MTMALDGSAHGSLRWPLVVLVLALAVALCAAGALADRRVLQRGRPVSGPPGWLAGRPGGQAVVRAVSHLAPQTSVALHDTCGWPAPTTLVRSCPVPPVERDQT